MTTTTLKTFSQGMGPLALAPMFPQLMEAFQSDLAAVVQLTGVCILVLGSSNFFWTPMQTSFGRWPVLILSTLSSLVSNIRRALATSYGSYMGGCVLTGFGAGPAETSQPEIIASGSFTNGALVALIDILQIGPIIAGPMAEHSGWRSFFWLNVGLLGLVLLLRIFLFPEAKWYRTHPDEATQTASPHGISSKVSETDKHIEFTQNENGDVRDGERDPYSHKGGPSKQHFMLAQLGGTNIKSVLLSFYIPWKLLAFPIA
ncbi:Major facilitator superfamily domain general substrate transporter [Penicillium paradoxum]|uniref:Major facilitator superfamily domain general substrate transporter n=1 Tax=Penicillium paradoxum TaxID=176176 RepID=UPI002547BFC2|nr:Major facilitator superfamily domain general substrate transporter [Penicillium paradoxum]KAJ5779854.1 Major facilitator superfamily domain general substrate transporter [Penicillium paradoxum]